MNVNIFRDYSKFSIFFYFFAFSFSILGQTVPPKIPKSGKEISPNLKTTPSIPQITNERDYLAVELRQTDEQKKRLLPDFADAEKFKDFLALPKTGLFRLMPDWNCESSNLVRMNTNCENFIPGGSFYSFRKRQHTNQFLYDLRLKDGNLIADGFLTQGIIVALGDISLDTINLESGGMKFLVDFTPEIERKKVLKQILEMIARGKQVNGYEYKKGLLAKQGETYAIRVVAYKGDDEKVNRGIDGNDYILGDRRYRQLHNDERTDIIVAFRVVKENKDGSLIILWKELKQVKAPILQN